jgi:uncharacterized membrane protein YdjX (TVP38/TMEM64 family)
MFRAGDRHGALVASLGLVVGCAVAFWVVRTILRPVYALLKLVSEPGKSSSPA